ncbi:DUF4974 domain-containing protein [Rhabdobacter roseus]|uniref:Ferric-dicitrate binding protein FerR (Iron transport regulator) n=1 Tax=Rhabdobacter roseus TaxID=1655419 RepID=A0A840THC8_9BACT|nr:FecR domain-containing protein [Rhabdobacter roseus]MBB5283556.1 ferric-dicitrate binding protein FerR (iron transport regulator) [Rhabdobacter roseus]
MKEKMNDHHPMDDLLVKALLDEASPAERREVDQWLLENEANRRYYDHFELIWKHSKQLAAHSQVDENASWERFKARTQETERLGRVVPLWSRPLFQRLLVAATVLLLAGAGWLAYLYAPGGAPERVVHSGEGTRTDTLPDGSVVVLNKKSTLTYPDRFADDKRAVALTGEGFFEVVADPEKPFVITINDVTVTVVGTSFNVKGSTRQTEVIVETGQVEVAHGNQKIRVLPQEKASVGKARAELTKQRVEDEFYAYYRTGKLVCEGTPLWLLVDMLNEIHEAQIVIGNPKIRDLKIHATFENQPVDQLLDVISETLSIRVERQGAQYILR